jgi:hypothetical protein
MITVKQIYNSGGACPYQLEGLTDSGEYFYLRYRGGRLRCGTWKSMEYFLTDGNYEYNIFDQVIGDRYDGFPDHERFMKLLKDKVIFPKWFRFESGLKGSP